MRCTRYTIIILLLLTACAKRIPMPAPPTPAPMPRAEIALARAPIAIGVMPIGLYMHPTGGSATDWAYYHSSGMAHINANFYAPHDYHQWPQYADSLQALGMKLIVSVGEEIFNSDAGISLVRPIANHPALLAVVLFDEPIWNVAVNGFAGAYNASEKKWLDGIAHWRQELPQVKLASVEPGMLPQLAPDFVELMHIYYADIDYIAVDHYPYPACSNPTHCGTIMRSTMQQFQQFGKPVWAVMQGSNYSSSVPVNVMTEFIRGSRDGGASMGWWWFDPNLVTFTGTAWSNMVTVTRAHGTQYPIPVPQRKTYLPVLRRQL